MGTQTKKTNKYMSLAAVTLAFSFTFLSRYIWSPLMADVSGEFGINATQAGLYMSAFFAGYLVTQIPGGIMADKYQPKYILIACTVLGGAMTALMSAINSYEMGLAIRVITGVSSGCVMAQCSQIGRQPSIGFCLCRDILDSEYRFIRFPDDHRESIGSSKPRYRRSVAI